VPKPMTMKMARASDKDWATMWRLKEIIESLVEYGMLPGEMEDEQPPDRSQSEIDSLLSERVAEWWGHNQGAWNRCVFGGQMVMEQACDPKSDVLEWNDTIKAAIASKPTEPTDKPEVLTG